MLAAMLYPFCTDRIWSFHFERSVSHGPQDGLTGSESWNFDQIFESSVFEKSKNENKHMPSAQLSHYKLGF